MKRTIILYSLAMAALILLLKVVEYRYFIHDLSIEFYVGVIAVLFTVLGVWIGWKVTHKRPLPQGPSGPVNDDVLKKVGISKREYEVLELMAQGLSNQEIADRLFVSLNTIKSHSSSLFLKLESRRRTQAIQHAKKLGLL